MKVLFIFVAALLVMCPALAEEEPKKCKSLDECLVRVSELENDINILNLINGLNLTKEQVTVILREAQTLRTDLKIKPKPPREIIKSSEEELKILKAMRDNLLKKGETPHSLRLKYETHHAKKYVKAYGWKMKPSMVKRVEQSTEKVIKVLTNPQVSIISDYKACLIPPKDLKNPVRVGQAESNDGVERFLTGMRELPEFVYVNHFNKIMDEALEDIEEHHGYLEPEEKSAYKNLVKDNVDKARRMSDVEYALNKARIAEKIKPKDKFKEIGQALAELGVGRYKISGKVSQLLLNPRVVLILEKRLKQMKTQAK